MTPGMQQTVQHNQHYTAHTDDDNNNDEGVSFNFHIAASTSNQKFTFNMTDIESKLRDAPDKYLFFVAHYLAGHINDTDAMDHLNGPLLKSSIKSIYWIFVMQYALLAFLGIVMNVAIIAHIGYHRMFKDVTHAFIANLALCHVVQCAVVLPVTLMVMLIQNWIFGQFLCFFLPMLQDIPLHVALITHILIAWDRMRWLSDPLKCRIPAFVCCCATWLTGMVIALPYPIYTIYVEIGDFLPRLHGVGLCVVNLMDDMHEYMRGLFFLMYCAPALLLAYIYIKTSQELRPPIGPIAEYRAEIRMRQRNSSTSSVERSYSNATTATAGAIKIPTYSTGTATRTYDLYNAELDLYREKHNQRTFGGMAAAQIFCICPLMVLRFARLSLEETYENQKHFDFTYLMLVWIAFLPTIIFPFIYGTQILPRTDRKRFRDYFNLSMKRLPKTTQNVINENNLDEYRENAIEKDESTNVSQRTSIILNGDNNTSELCGTSRDRIIEKMHEVIKTVPQFQYNKDIKHDPYSNQFTREQEQKGESLDDYETAVANSYLQNCLKMERTEEKVQTTQTQNRSRINRNDLKIPPVCDASNKFRTLYRSQGPTETSINCNNSNIREGCDAKLTQLKVNLDSLDNWSFSNATASTYCNGTESYRNDDADASNFGDGDDSSIVSDILVSDPLSGSGIGLPPYSNSKMSSYTDILKSRVISTSDFSNYSCMNSANTISSEMNILNFSERNPSGMDKSIREHRRLPNIEKFCYGSPNNNKVPVTPVSTLSAKVPVVNINNPLGPHRDTLSRTGTLITELSSESGQSMSRSTKTSFEEDIPSDYDDCKKENDPITHKTMESTPVNSPVEIQYQYCRRANRKSLHFHNNITNPCHRLYKRENFNSLQNNDLIAGAFGELDPTQPLTKMSVIENRIMMQRSSGINRGVNGGNSSSGRKSTSFLATGRSSSKSRDFSQSSHSAQPELDFRENIFAEL